MGSIVVFEDSQSAFWGAAEIRKSKDVSPDKIVIDTLILEASLLMESDMVEVTLYDKDMTALEYVEFGLKPLTEDANTDDLVTRAAEKVKSLEKIIDGRLVYPGMARDECQCGDNECQTAAVREKLCKACLRSVEREDWV
jgi:hypothetical protein